MLQLVDVFGSGCALLLRSPGHLGQKKQHPAKCIAESQLSRPGQGKKMSACRVIVQEHSLDGVGAEQLPASTRSHHFASQLHVFSPTAPAAGSRLGCPAFTVATIRPAALLDERFLQDYIRHGALYVMTTGAGSDRHNTLCIAGGLLHLTVDAETYSQLGLLGRASGVHPRKQFFRVQVDLRGQDFRPGDSNYDRALWCLSRMQPLRVLASHSVDGDTTRAVLFPAELKSESRQACCRTSSRALELNTRIPSPGSLLAAAPSSSSFSREVTGETIQDLLEWLGFAHGTWPGCIAAGAPIDEFATHLKSPQILDWVPGTGFVREVRGFITPPTVDRVILDTIEAVRSQQLPWATVVVWGFADAPVSWGTSAHRFAAGAGDNVSVVLVLPGGVKAVFADLVSGCDEHG